MEGWKEKISSKTYRQLFWEVLKWKGAKKIYSSRHRRWNQTEFLVRWQIMYYGIYVGWGELSSKEEKINAMWDRWYICRMEVIGRQ